jgi:acyl dehydratase
VSQSKPDRGFLKFRIDMTNQRGETMLEQVHLMMFGRREASLIVSDLPVAEPAAPEVLIRVPAEDNPELLPVGPLRPGMTVNLGSHDFTAEAIIDFGHRYDPQPFHLSEEAGRASHFGGLAASGWHTGAAWMGSLVTFRKREAEAGRFVPRLGPSPGFRDLQWRKPVLAGDRITYFSRVLDARPSASRPGWGIVNHRNYGLNQRGEVVFAFTGTVLWEAAT